MLLIPGFNRSAHPPSNVSVLIYIDERITQRKKRRETCPMSFGIEYVWMISTLCAQHIYTLERLVSIVGRNCTKSIRPRAMKALSGTYSHGVSPRHFMWMKFSLNALSKEWFCLKYTSDYNQATALGRAIHWLFVIRNRFALFFKH